MKKEIKLSSSANIKEIIGRAYFCARQTDTPGWNVGASEWAPTRTWNGMNKRKQKMSEACNINNDIRGSRDYVEYLRTSSGGTGLHWIEESSEWAHESLKTEPQK